MGPGRSPGAAREQAVIGEVVEGFSQCRRGVHDDLLQRVHRPWCAPSTAVSRVIFSWRIISTAPSAVFGMAVDCPASYGPRGDLRVEGVGLAGGPSRAPVAPIHFDNPMPRAAHRTCQAGAIAAGAFDAERVNPPVGLGPRDQRLVAARLNNERVIAENGSPSCRSPPRRGRAYAYQRRRSPSAHQAAWVCGGHRYPSSGCGPSWARVGGQDCDGPWVQQAPMGSRPIRSAGRRTSGRWAMTDRSVARTKGQSS